MKKTKIIIPALAALCLGAVASVSGTLAWFSASKSKSVGVNNIAVVNTQGSLNAEPKASKNTKVVSNNISLDSNVKLRDASAQIAKASSESQTVWEATNVSTEGTATTYQKVADTLVYNETSSSKICYAATWEITFSMPGSDPDDYDIYFDAANSSTSVADGDVAGIYGAFRIGIYNADTLVVWNNLAGDDNLAYVNSASSTSTYTRTKAATKLGKIGSASGGSATAKELTVYCIAWFEGCDSSCKTTVLGEGKESKATSELKFYASKAA